MILPSILIPGNVAFATSLREDFPLIDAIVLQDKHAGSSLGGISSKWFSNREIPLYQVAYVAKSQLSKSTVVQDLEQIRWVSSEDKFCYHNRTKARYNDPISAGHF